MNKEPIIFIFQFYGILKFWEDPIGKVPGIFNWDGAIKRPL